MIAWVLGLALVLDQSASAGGNSWNKIRYSGGTIAAKVNPYDWNTVLTVSSSEINLVFGYRQTVRIQPAQVTALSYGEEAHRRIEEMVALGVLVPPVALFGIMHKGKEHFIGIEFTGEDGKPASVLLEVHKDSYWAILQALKTVTGKPVLVSP